MSQTSRVAVVTGANRGIGFEIARQLARQLGATVVGTARDAAKGAEAAAKLRAEGLNVAFFPLEVDSEDGAKALAGYLAREHGRLDILVNNAGVYLDGQTAPLELEIDTMRRTFETNVYGPLRLIQALAPLLRKSGRGRVVNVSSQMGQLNGMGAGVLAYRASKSALNAITGVLSHDLKKDGVLVNSMCPGWVKTDMGGPNAPGTVQDGADTAIFLADLPDDGPTGGFFQGRKPIAW